MFEQVYINRLLCGGCSKLLTMRSLLVEAASSESLTTKLGGAGPRVGPTAELISGMVKAASAISSSSDTRVTQLLTIGRRWRRVKKQRLSRVSLCPLCCQENCVGSKPTNTLEEEIM